MTEQNIFEKRYKLRKPYVASAPFVLSKYECFKQINSHLSIIPEILKTILFVVYGNTLGQTKSTL